MKPIHSSPKLLEFYKWWRDTNATITHHHGLCVVLMAWTDGEGPETVGRLCREMKHQFEEAGLDENLPFNNGNFISFNREVMTSSMRQNANRIAWVKARIEDGTKK